MITSLLWLAAAPRNSDHAAPADHDVQGIWSCPYRNCLLKMHSPHQFGAPFVHIIVVAAVVAITTLYGRSMVYLSRSLAVGRLLPEAISAQSKQKRGM